MRMRCALTVVVVLAAATAPLRAQNAIRAFWVVSPTDIWVMEEGPNAVHFDGTAWTGVPLGGTGNFYINGMWGSGTADVWAVGATFESGPCAFHWDGTRWLPVVLPPSVTSGLVGVTGRGPREVYVAATAETESDTGAVAIWNGSAWSAVREPIAFVTNGIAMVGTELWVAGTVTRDPTPTERRDYGLLARYAGGRWILDGFNGTRVTNPLLAGNGWSGASAGGVRNMLVGNDTAGALVLALNEGSVWRTVAAPPEAEAAFLLGNGRLIALGGSAEFTRYTASGWVPFAAQASPAGQSRPAPLSDVRSAWSAVGSETAYVAAGSRLARVQSDSVRVVFDMWCWLDARQINAPACRTLGAGGGVAAPRLVVPSAAPASEAVAAPGAVNRKYGRAIPSGLPQPARSGVRPTPQGLPSGAPRPKP